MAEVPHVDKISALETLKRGRILSVVEFAEKLSKRGFDVADPRKAWNTLNRLRRQGLAEQVLVEEKVHYRLPTAAGERLVTRKSYRGDWRITDRGKKRLEWLQTHPRGGD